jgi:hypothetical protein
MPDRKENEKVMRCHTDLESQGHGMSATPFISQSLLRAIYRLGIRILHQVLYIYLLFKGADRLYSDNYDLILCLFVLTGRA